MSSTESVTHVTRKDPHAADRGAEILNFLKTTFKWDESTYTITSKIPPSAALKASQLPAGSKARYMFEDTAGNPKENSTYDYTNAYHVVDHETKTAYTLVTGTADDVYDAALFDAKTGKEIAFNDVMHADNWLLDGQKHRGKSQLLAKHVAKSSEKIQGSLRAQVRALEHWINYQIGHSDVGIDQNLVTGSDINKAPGKVQDLLSYFSKKQTSGSSAALYNFNLNEVSKHYPDLAVWGVESYAPTGKDPSADVMVLFAMVNGQAKEVATGKDNGQGGYAWTLHF
jgi:hypothetical protein